MTLFYLQKELTPPQEASVDIYKASQKAYNNALQHKEYHVLADLWKNCMNSYLTSQFTADNTKQTELWEELTNKEDMYKIEVINLIQAFQHEYRNSQRCSNNKRNDIKQILNTLPRVSTPLNQNEGTRIPNPQVLDPDSSQLKNELSTSFHNLEPSMGQAPLKEVPKLKEWPHFSGEGEYDHMEFIIVIDMIEEYFELPERLVTARLNTLFTRSAHNQYIKLRQAHGHQSWTWWKS
ncbi:hypothetical protein O181_056325 [Austropuccinia psidii MF-1]|uniref:Uncharacterized protein n=1 Tax=Austropuccinia psidii MF-1 TaxID=1389203 RepID=A0A9Q3HW07_9BASI|nr:hypothetical protein [Austropuccinia psidii MF-1]